MNQPRTTPSATKSRPVSDSAWHLLLFNHADAWGVTLVIAAIALLVHSAFSLPTVYWLIAITVGYWGAFALNDYYDAPYDAHDPVKARRNYFVDRPMARRTLRTIFAVLALFVVPAFVQFGWIGVLVIAAALFIMWAYSAPPLRLKSRPVLDLLTHAVCVETFPYLAALLLIDAEWGRRDAVALATTFLASLTAQLEQQARDFEVDSATDRNFTTTFGLATTVVLLRVFTALLIAVPTYFVLDGTIPPVIVPVLLIPLPALLHRFVRPPDVPRSQRLVQWSVALALLYVVGLLIVVGVRRSLA